MKKIKRITICLWIASVSAIISLMHSWHYVDLSPREDTHVELKTLLPSVETLGIAHFLTPKCSCSLQVFHHLIKRSPMEGEMIVLIDDENSEFKDVLGKSGYKVKSIDTKGLSKDYSELIKGVPLLVIYDNEMETKYIGGYDDRAITPFTEIDIGQYIHQIQQNRKIASKPVIGCAISKQYQNFLDPLGLKYQDKN